MVTLSASGSTTKPSSIEAIVTESRPLYSQPMEGYYLVHGKLQFFEISSPYQHINEGATGMLSFGEIIGDFTISGVVEQEGYVLAFRYDARESFQPKKFWQLKAHPEGPEGIEKEDLEWLGRSRRAGLAKYLHLCAALEQPKVIVHLRGGIEYAPPRLLSATGIYVDGELLKYSHGDIDGKDFRHKPLHR